MGVLALEGRVIARVPYIETFAIIVQKCRLGF